jgi:autotransporter-associated beta strand protein
VDSDVIVRGGSVGSTSKTSNLATIDRNLLLIGAGGGIDVANNALTWSGSISGGGQFVKSGSGNLTLTGTNTYSGGTQVVGGALIIGSDAELGKAGTGVNLAGGGLIPTRID